MHVSPGRTESRRSCHDWYFATSPGSGGRGPTTLMSPRSTLMSCGSSSMEYFRRMAPTRVTRGSFRILNTGPLRVLDHRAELEHLEGLAVQPAPQLTEEHWPP